jgi:hypothetical protein
VVPAAALRDAEACFTDAAAAAAAVLLLSGGEAARAVLSAVSKVGAVPVTNLGEGKPKQAAATAADELRWDWSEAGIAL